MAKTIQVSVDTSDLKVLNTHLNTTKKTIQMTAKSAKSDFKQLKMSIDPVYRAEKLFTKQVLVAQKAVATGAISNNEYSRTFAMIQKNAQASGMTLNQFGQVANVNTRKMKRFGAVGMQQVGYQVQDFAVQVQGGTSAMVALGQQGSQLLGIFGPAGAIAGMILAIGTGLAGAFMAAKKAGDESISTAKLYKDAMEESATAVRSLKDENYMLANSIQSVSVAKLKQALIAIKQEKADKEAAEQAFLDQEAKNYKYGAGAIKVDFGDRKTSMFGETYNEAIAKIEAQIKKTQSVFDENLGLKKEQQEAEELKKLQKAREDYIKTLIIQSDEQTIISDNTGRELLLAKQVNEMNAVERHLKELGLELDDEQYQRAYRYKELEQEAVLLAYDAVQAEKDRLQAIKDADADYKKRIALAKKAHEAAKLAAADLIALNKSIGSSMENAMMSMVDGTKSVKDAFKDMAREIIKELYRIYVVKKITGMITGAIENKFAPDIATTASAIPKANGGPVNAGQRYIVGERGPEVFTPTMGGHITPNSGGGGSGTTIVQNINVSTGVQQTVRAEIRQMMPQIADSAKGAVLDAKRRGGSYGRAMA